VKSAVESLEPTKVKLTIEIEPDDLKPALDRAYKEISGQISVPGFRPGRVPRRIIDNRIGRGVVIEQAINDALSDWYREALREHELSPMGQADVDVTRKPDPVAAEPDLEITATVEIRPEIKIPDLGNVKVVVDSAEPSEEKIQEMLDDLRERFASLKPVDRPAGDGDYVTIDIKAEIEGEEVDSVSGVSYKIGSNTMLDGLDEALDGLSPGEETTFNAPMAGGERKGQEGLVTVKLESVKDRELPPADDEFALMASEFDTIDELREDLKRLAGQLAERDQVIQAQDRLVDHLLETLDFPAPPGVVQKDVDARIERAGKDSEDEAVVAEFKADAVKAIRTQLLMDALVDLIKPTATNNELIGFVARTAQGYGMDPAAFAKAATDAGELPHFAAELLRNKAAVEALRQITVEDADGQPVDLKSRLTRPVEQALGDDLAEHDGDAAIDQSVVDEALVEEVAIDLESLVEDDKEA
jgi:trigger factor